MSDYNAIYPSTDTTNTTSVNTSVGSLFRNRRYYELALEGTDIRNVLSDSSFGRRAVINFPQNPGIYPALDITDNANNIIASYSLHRSNGEGIFEPVPDRYFLNSSDLNSSSNITATRNMDIADRSGAPVSPRYTYVSMYIVVSGMDDNYTPIYSNPTFIGILRLPESS
jgi:hypothetical protein